MSDRRAVRSILFLLTGSRESTPGNLALAGLLLLGLVLFAVPRRPAGSQDFMPLYGGARCLLHGGDPYSWRDQQQALAAAAGPWKDAGYWRDFPIAYPPLTYVLLSGIALLDWPQAALVWRGLLGLAFAAGALATVHAVRPQGRWLAAAAVSGILATSQIVLLMGQITLLDVGLLALGCALLLCGRPAAGLLLTGLAVGLKPQLGGLLLLYFLLPRRTRRPAVLTVAALALLAAASALWFSHRPATRGWTAELRQNIAAGQAPEGPMDPGVLGEFGENQMLSLQQLTRSLAATPRGSDLAAWTATGLIGAWLLAALLRMPEGYDRDALAVAALAMLALLPVYHHLYDMRVVLLTVPALGLVFARSARVGALLAVVTGLLFFSTSLVAVRLAGARGREWLSHHLLLQILVARQQALAALLLALGYTALCWRLGRGGEDRPVAQPAPRPGGLPTSSA